MAGEWRQLSLSEVAEVIDSRHKTPQYTDFGFPMVRVVDVKGGLLNLRETKKVSHEDYIDYSKGRDPEVGDLIFSRVGSYGNISYVDQTLERFCLGQNTAVIVPKEEWRFLYYLLLSPQIKNQIETQVVGAVQKTVSLKSIKTLDLQLPPLPEQKAIAHVLGSLDDKIELNRRMNETLEGMAQALFKSWFVDFDPVIDNALAAGNSIPEPLAQRAETRLQALANGTANRESAQAFPASFRFTEELGWIPEGWEVKAVKDFGNIICGKTPSKSKAEFYGEDIPFIKIPDMHSSVWITQTSDGLSKVGAASQSKKQIPANSICVSCIATVGKVVITSEESHTNQQINSVVPHDTMFRDYLYFTFSSINKELHDLASGGSATLNLNTGNFSKINLLKPSVHCLEKFSHSTANLFQKILCSDKESQTLAKLRDVLLPKLISGELRIPQAEKMVEDAIA
jgi:type I restriction enzyme S subunit